MPTLVEIVTNLVSTMRAVPSAGAVHPRARSARTSEQIARLVRSHGWVLQYLGSREREGRGFIDILMLVQPTGFTSPTVRMAARFECLGDVTVTAL